MATKKQPETPEVRNKVTIFWFDDDGNQHEHVIRLKRPKGRAARQAMPRVLAFLSDIGDYQTEIEKAGDQSIGAQAELINKFEAHEDLFPFILQVEDNSETGKVLEDLTIIELMEPVFNAAQYLVSESLNRPEVQQALKKLDGATPAEGETSSPEAT